MSDAEFAKEAGRVIKQFEREARHAANLDELRKVYREEHKMIYVKTYTVQAHMRKFKPRRHKVMN